MRMWCEPTPAGWPPQSYGAVCSSPQLTRLFKLLERYVLDQGERVLVYVDTPALQQLVTSVMPGL